MAYEHDLFISYRRNDETRTWIKDHFIPLLRLRVEMELDRCPVIFLDEQIDSGRSWPQELGTALGRSRGMIVLWSGNYLASTWCATELSVMLARERACRLRSNARPDGLVIPAFIHDGDKFPPALQHIQRFEIQQTFNVRMARNSPRAEELDVALGQQAPAIASAIRNAPPWRARWPEEAAERIFETFYQRGRPVQRDVPRFAA
jgi:hypothetical protein